MDEIKNKVPIETNLEHIHKLATTEAQLAKAQQKLQQHGIQMTPQRNTSNTPDLPTESTEQDTGSQPADPNTDNVEADTQQAAKKPRLTRTKSKATKPESSYKTDMATILNPTTMTLQYNHPSSHTDTKVTQWLDDIKDKKLHTHVKKVVGMFTSMNKKDRPNLVETAIRYGVPMDEVQQMSYKSLSHVVAAGAYFAI